MQQFSVELISNEKKVFIQPPKNRWHQYSVEFLFTIRTIITVHRLCDLANLLEVNVDALDWETHKRAMFQSLTR